MQKRSTLQAQKVDGPHREVRQQGTDTTTRQPQIRLSSGILVFFHLRSLPSCRPPKTPVKPIALVPHTPRKASRKFLA